MEWRRKERTVVPIVNGRKWTLVREEYAERERERERGMFISEEIEREGENGGK